MSNKEYFLTIAEKVDYKAVDIAGTHISKYIDLSPAEIIKDTIESGLIFRPADSNDDIKDAETLAVNLGFADLADWVSYYLRKSSEPFLNTCANCSYFQDENFCPRAGYTVNPNFCNKPCFTKRNTSWTVIDGAK